MLNEPFRSFREIELLVEKARASYCFFQHKVQKLSLRDIAREQGMSYERVRHLAERAATVYGMSLDDFDTDIDTDKR
jgi:hypothetical protein